MADGDHHRNVAFTPALRLKDVQYALRLARKLGIGSPFGALTENKLRRLCELGLEDANESIVFEIARDLEVNE
jgi:3-hydroxyisobutyrate dehydrogenase-like beta-hydroxyacid dehydrogenase